MPLYSGIHHDSNSTAYAPSNVNENKNKFLDPDHPQIDLFLVPLSIPSKNFTKIHP